MACEFPLGDIGKDTQMKGGLILTIPLDWLFEKFKRLTLHVDEVWKISIKDAPKVSR